MKLTKSELRQMIKQTVLELCESGELDLQALVEDVVLEAVAANKNAIVKAVLRESNRRLSGSSGSQDRQIHVKQRAATSNMKKRTAAMMSRPGKNVPNIQKQNLMSEAAELYGEYAQFAIDTISDAGMQKFLAEEKKYDKHQEFLSDPHSAMLQEVEEGPNTHIDRLRQIPFDIQQQPGHSVTKPEQLTSRMTQQPTHVDNRAQHMQPMKQPSAQDDVNVPDDLSVLGLGNMKFDVDMYDAPRAAASSVAKVDTKIMQQIFNDHMQDLS